MDPLPVASTRRVPGQDGFTLIELLVVILIIGILAAIALPVFLGQRARAQDANAKSDVRNLVSQMEVCYTELDGYVGCREALTALRTGLPIGSGPGRVEVVDEAPDGYSLVGHSRSGATFTVLTGPDGRVQTCLPAGEAGCPATGEW